MTAAIVRADARHLPLPDASVDLIVTSPPYWGLRSYSDGGEHYDGQLGSEPTPREWLDVMLEATAEMARVLKPTGSIFINLGDKYSDRAGPTWAGSSDRLTGRPPKPRRGSGTSMAPRKSLLGLPWRFAIAAVDELGLILRRDIVWSKPTAIPEAVDDRCRTAHEYLFHLTKAPRYFADLHAVREPYAATRHAVAPGGAMSRAGHDVPKWGINGSQSLEPGKRYVEDHRLGKPPTSVWPIVSVPLHVPAVSPLDGRPLPEHYAAFPPELASRCIRGWSPVAVCLECGTGRFTVAIDEVIGGTIYPRRRPARQDADYPAGRNGWNGQAYPRGARVGHVAGYACACTPFEDRPASGGSWAGDRLTSGGRPLPTGRRHDTAARPPRRVYGLDGWQAPASRPAVVADPFGGSGTVALVADVLGRHAVTVDLSHDYGRIARWRVTDPGERARAACVPRPPAQTTGQLELLSATTSSEEESA